MSYSEGSLTGGSVPPSPNDAPKENGRATFVSAVKAWQESIKLYTYLIGLIAGLPLVVRLLDEKLGIGSLWISGALAAVPALLILVYLFSKWIDERNRHRMEAMGRGEVKDPRYFRLVPYGPRDTFVRSDGIQHAVYQWVTDSREPLLYLTGRSGSGKSSIISGWIIPEIARQGTPITVVEARIVDDPISAIRQVLAKHRAIPSERSAEGAPDLRQQLEQLVQAVAPRTLLLVLDQFEEFLILASEGQQSEFGELLRSLADRAIPGLRVLMILRSDYLGFFGKLKLPLLTQSVNWEEVPPFSERAAMTFLKNSALGLTRDLEDAIINEAREIEETKGTIRPITINLFGLLLSRFQSLPRGYQAGSLLRSHLRDVIQRKGVREFAPRILGLMMTANGTKIPTSLAQLVQKTGFEAGQVRGCLVHLGSEGLVRELDRSAGIWEIAHDFIASLYDRILVGWRMSFWKRQSGWLLATALLVWGVSVSFVPFLVGQWRDNAAKETLAQLHIGLSLDIDGRLEATATEIFSDEDLKRSVPVLALRPVRTLDLSFTQVHNLEPLRSLTGLQKLNLSLTHVQSLEPLLALTGLQKLELKSASFGNLEPLRALQGLQELNLRNDPVQNLEPLGAMTGLQRLNLSGTQVQSLEPLRALTRLQELNLSSTRVQDLEPLRALTSLQKLDISATDIQDLEPLRELKHLQVER